MLSPEQKAQMRKVIATHNGKPTNPKAMLHPVAMISKVLIARYLNMTPQQQDALKTIFTPQNADALEALLPEVKGLIKKEGGNGAG